MLRIFMSVLLFAFCVPVFPQAKTDANVYGHVINKETREHLPFLSISIKGTTIGTSTDGTGHYYLKNLPIGKAILLASGLGFQSKEVAIELLANTTLNIDFELIEDAVLLESVVVSANRNETNRREAPTIVNIISPKIFESTNSVCLAQGLNFQPGLRVETNCQNCGFQQVRINGLDGPYSQVLIDSRPVFSSLAGVYGLEQIPANMIDRVEVVRGGGSALFGSNAIAGTINIITREPVANSVVLSNTTNLIGSKALDLNTSINASIISDNHRTGIMLFGSSRQRGSFDYDGDGFTEVTQIRAKNIGFKAYYRLSDYSKLTIEYHNLGEYRRGGNKLDLPPHEADIAEQLDYTVNAGGAKYDWFSKDHKQKLSIFASSQAIDRSSYYGTQKNLLSYGTTTDLSVVAGAQYSYSFENLLFMPADVTLGSEININNLDDKIPGYNRFFTQDVQTNSFFLQNEWKNENWSLLLGTRLDKHNMISNAIASPRVNIRYNPTKNISLRASFSTGFRAPQAFDEDLHIGIAGGEAVIIALDPNLETERSKSYSASIDLYHEFGKTKTNLLIEGFYTNLSNVFILQAFGADTAGNTLMQRTNGVGAIVKGINIEGKLVPSAKLQLQFGATIQQSQYKEAIKWSDELPPQKTMFRAPDQYGYITASLQPTKKLSASFSGTYTGSILVQHYAGYIPRDIEVTTKSFFDLTIKLMYDLAINNLTKVQLNLGAQNLFNSYQNDFDKGINRDAAYIYGPALPRTLFAGIKILL
jgi:outer membrane receptor for ferrienterochelin and colicins